MTFLCMAKIFENFWSPKSNHSKFQTGRRCVWTCVNDFLHQNLVMSIQKCWTLWTFQIGRTLIFSRLLINLPNSQLNNFKNFRGGFNLVGYNIIFNCTCSSNSHLILGTTWRQSIKNQSQSLKKSSKQTKLNSKKQNNIWQHPQTMKLSSR